MESKDLAGPEQYRTSNASAVERIKVGGVLMPSRIEVKKDQGTAPQKCNQE